jgi:hypothetical protein
MKKNFVFCVLLMAGLACVAQAPWNGTVAEAYDGGDGTPGNPFQIATAEQLALLAYETNNGDGGNPNCYILTEDINLNGTKGYLWTPIGTVKTEWHPTNPNIQPANPFMGVFEGNDHVISEMYANDKDVLGLFGCTVDATVRNVQITESNLTLGDYVGMVAGLSVNTNIINCTAGSVIRANGNKVGGIVGHFVAEGIGNDTVFVKDCVSDSEINYGDMYLGGIVGYTTMNNGNVLIEHCVNQGDIGTMTNSFSAGGMVGQGSYIIRNCHNYGKVSAQITAGGMVGQGGTFGLIECCINHASAEVMGGSSAGGIIGTPIHTVIKKCGNRALVTGKGDNMILVGGICGSDGSISNCYNTGNLKAIATAGDVEVVTIGGITGTPTEGFVYNVYNTGQIIKPANPNLPNTWYAHIIPVIMSDTAIRNCYWYGNEDIPTYVYNAESHSYVYLPESCVFNAGATSTTWILNEAQYGTTDLLEALNLGAMGECVWVEDEDGVNGGFPVIGLMDPDNVSEITENQFNIYPNPTNNILFVETRHGTSLQNQTYRITNLMGQTLQTGHIVSDNHPLDVSTLPVGIYLLTIDGVTQKFVVK